MHKTNAFAHKTNSFFTGVDIEGESYTSTSTGAEGVVGSIVGKPAEVQGEYMPGNGDPPTVADTGALIDD